MPVYRFCPQCATELAWRELDGRRRQVCPACGFIHYENPVPAAGCLVERDEQVLMVQRGISPHIGAWTLPAGFVEWDETPEQAAVRETYEETGLEVRTSRLFGVFPWQHEFNDGQAHDNGLLVIYLAEVVGGELRPGDDAQAVGWFGLKALPGEIAFASHRTALAMWRELKHKAQVTGRTAPERQCLTFYGSSKGGSGAMDELALDLEAEEPNAAPQWSQPVSGTYTGQRGRSRLVLRVDVREQSPAGLYQPLNLLSGDFYRDDGAGNWEYRSSFVVEHPQITWHIEAVAIAGTMATYRDLELSESPPGWFHTQILRATIPLRTPQEPPAAAVVKVIWWGVLSETFVCDKTSAFLRTIELEIDRLAGTELPQPYSTHAVATRPPDLPEFDLDIPRAFQRAGIDLCVISDSEVLVPLEAGTDLLWDEDELHHAMAHHFSQWRDEPQWKLYLLVASHFRLYPGALVTGLMYDAELQDPPRQGAAVFYSTMRLPEVWGGLPDGEFDRNCIRTCVHELGHALNLLHSFDKDRPDSLSWMNYPWRYPHGYRLPAGWDGTHDFWQQCRFEFDPEELRHLRHDALIEVIPGGAGFGALGHDAPGPAPAVSQADAGLVLYVRTRPERALFGFAEPVTVEVKLKNQGRAPALVADQLNPEFGLVSLLIRDPQGRVHRYRPLFHLCAEPQAKELPAGESLYETIFLAYGAGGFYFQEPGEYRVWAFYEAGPLRLKSNGLRIRIAYPQKAAEEEIALRVFEEDQGHVLYMQGAPHLAAANDQLREIAERFPNTHLARYIHLCFGWSQAKEFKDLVAGEIRPPQPDRAAEELEQAVALLSRPRRSGLDNITHGRAVDLLVEVYRQLDREERAKAVLAETVAYFQRMDVKRAVIEDMKAEAKAL